MGKSVLRYSGIQGSSLQHPLYPQCFVFYCTFQPAPTALCHMWLQQYHGSRGHQDWSQFRPAHLSWAADGRTCSFPSCEMHKLSAWRHGLWVKPLIDLWGGGKLNWIKTFYCSPPAFLFTISTVPSLEDSSLALGRDATKVTFPTPSSQRMG